MQMDLSALETLPIETTGLLPCLPKVTTCSNSCASTCSLVTCQVTG